MARKDASAVRETGRLQGNIFRLWLMASQWGAVKARLQRPKYENLQVAVSTLPLPSLA